ncbi:MAG: undecaprenyl-diphosphate phosphatase [Clostridia bacterium]|nr:undecaprenyl-diphosphate phosphatase [Clostridia bacterium]
MTVLQAIVLGAVQGFAEFLPISSSGHLILLQNVFGIENNVLFYSVMLHIGTLIPVIIVLFKDIIQIIKVQSKFWCLVVATIPAGIVGVVLGFFDIDAIFANNIWLLAITFLFTAGMLLFSEKRAKKVVLNREINFTSATFMGLGQAIGVLPGISRSGATLSGGTLARVKKDQNASFTFLMSIPIILFAALIEGYKCYKNGAGNIATVPLLIGMLTAMITGYIAIKFMLKVIRKANYKWFSLYLVGVALFTMVSYFVKF